MTYSNPVSLRLRRKQVTFASVVVLGLACGQEPSANNGEDAGLQNPIADSRWSEGGSSNDAPVDPRTDSSDAASDDERLDSSDASSDQSSMHSGDSDAS